VEIDKTSKDDDKNRVIISVKDTGEGIDINILLFYHQVDGTIY
jgi:hypothetical protein